MREREAKDQTFAKGTFGRFVKKHGIEREIVPIDPQMMVESPRVKRTNVFVVSLEKGGNAWTRTMVFDRNFEFLPEAEDVLENVANDIAAFRYFKDDPEALGRLLGLGPDDPRIRAHMEELAQTVATFRDLVGDAAYDEFLTITEARGPLPEEFERGK